MPNFKNSFRHTMQTLVSSLVYPVKKGNWYHNKGYKSFEDFVEKQKNSKKPIFPDMQYVNAKKSKVDVKLGEEPTAKLDSLTLTPTEEINKKNLPGKGKHIIYFFGRNEPYEVKYRELLQDAKEIGATIHAFNLPGMNESTGKMLEFNDAVNSGLAQLNTLLEQDINPDDIILKGNCFGASIASEVQHRASIHGIQIRNINSNSYRTFKDVILEALPKATQGIAKIFLKLLDYTGWNVNVEEKILVQNPYTCVIQRKGDKTLRGNSKLYQAIDDFYKGTKDPKRDFDARDLSIAGFEEGQKFLNTHNTMHLNEKAKTRKKKPVKDPHVAQLADLHWIDENGWRRAPHEFISTYIKQSNEYIKDHRQIAHVSPVPYVKRITEPNIDKVTELEFKKLNQQVTKEKNSSKQTFY